MIEKSLLDINIRHKRGDFLLEVQFCAQERVVALSGASGAGKTTLLHIIAGFIRADYAHISIKGKVLVDTASGVFIPPHRRRIACVFQEARLFPHLNVRQNLLYSHLFNAEPDKQKRENTFQAVLELLGIAPLLKRPAHALSGGEKQRVAIGRALLSNPRLLLMDEPLASLDAARKAEIFPYLERLRDETGIPILYVSHIHAEIIRLASQVVMIENGKMTGFDTVEALMR